MGSTMNDSIDDEIQSLIRLAIEKRRATERDIFPISAVEIDRVERDQGVRLPAAYRKFLMRMGGGFGNVCSHADMFFPAMLGLRSDTEELLQFNDIDYTLKEVDVPFHMHEGYYVAWMSGGGENPPVYSYSEAGMGVMRETDSFTDWIRMQIESSP